MCWSRALTLLVCAAACENAVAQFAVGAGLEGDTDSGLAETVFGDVAIGDDTWLSAVVAHTDVELPNREQIDSWYADLSLDHFFEPVGIRAGIAYWGDSDVLDSTDWRGSLYWRNDGFRISANVERRNFELVIPERPPFPGREVSFEADGLGLSVGFDLSESVDLYFSGMDYGYSVDLRISNREELLRLLTVSRLSLINSLVDYRAGATLGVDLGLQRLSLDVGTWRGEVDGGDTRSITLRWLTPLGRRADLELGLGYDDAELYGEVTFFSVYLFFYGD